MLQYRVKAFKTSETCSVKIPVFVHRANLESHMWFIHSFIHILSFPLILFLLNHLCFSFKFVERFLSCILQNGISGDDVPLQGGRTQRRPTGQEREKCESTILLKESISYDKIISQRLNTHFGGSVLYQTNNLVQIKYLLILIFTFHTLWHCISTMVVSSPTQTLRSTPVSSP